ncbi:hypothetical protein BaRGS_00005752 [Batillaria attramentaria]|uniref:Uncharacterized protein n=1 Tax=Batillaria attramentaria TaxID=370345 RepID=A0ABD0LUC5_9CAEN
MIFEEVLEAISPWGRYQKLVYLLIAVTGIPHAMNTMVTVFLLASPTHRRSLLEPPGFGSHNLSVEDSCDIRVDSIAGVTTTLKQLLLSSLLCKAGRVIRPATSFDIRVDSIAGVTTTLKQLLLSSLLCKAGRVIRPATSFDIRVDSIAGVTTTLKQLLLS